MDWKVTTEPAAEPVTLAEAKLHLRVDFTDDDALITSLIRSAREWCQGYQNRAFVLQTLTAKLGVFSNKMALPSPPLINVDSIKYIDGDGVQQTLSTDYYDVDTTSEPGLITLAYNQSWPTTRSVHHAVEIIYKAGYATPFTVVAATDVITATGHSYSDGDIVRLSNSGGSLPGGLSTNTDYYVRDVSGDTLKLAATSDGAAIDITDTGTGTNFLGEVPGVVIAAMKLLIGHLYEYRETVSEEALKETPFAVRALLGLDRIYMV